MNTILWICLVLTSGLSVYFYTRLAFIDQKAADLPWEQVKRGIAKASLKPYGKKSHRTPKVNDDTQAAAREKEQA